MGNCLKTQLKEIVNNGALSKLGVIRIHITKQASVSSGQNLFIFSPAENCTVKVIGNVGGFNKSQALLDSDPKTEMVLPATPSYITLYFANETYDVEISNKYTLYNLWAIDTNNSIVSFNLDDLKYSTDITRIRTSGKNNTGNLSSVEGFDNIQELRLYKTNVSGDLTSLSALTSLTSIDLSDSLISGNLSSLANCVNLSSLQLNRTNCTGNLNALSRLTSLSRMLCNSILIDGTLEAFVEGQIANGRSSCSPGSLNTVDVFSQVSFGGNIYSTETGYVQISWESASKITCYAAENYTQATRIYAKGATAEEIAAWEQAGKTVVVVD